MWAALSPLVLWLAAIAAYAYEDGMNLFQWMGRFSQVLERPFSIGWTAHTPKFMLVSLIIYAFGIALYYSGRENRRPGEEYGSAKWGDPKALCQKYMDHQHKEANITLRATAPTSTPHLSPVNSSMSIARKLSKPPEAALTSSFRSLPKARARRKHSKPKTL